VAGVDSHQAFFPRSAKAAAVLAVHHHAAGEHHFAVLLGNRDRKFPPMQKILADSMPPAHVAPLIAERIELKEEVILAVKIDQPVGIVGPMLAGGEVHLRTVGLAVGDGLGSDNGCRKSKCACVQTANQLLGSPHGRIISHYVRGGQGIPPQWLGLSSKDAFQIAALRDWIKGHFEMVEESVHPKQPGNGQFVRKTRPNVYGAAGQEKSDVMYIRP
jgi:hypothetical protein